MLISNTVPINAKLTSPIWKVRSNMVARALLVSTISTRSFTLPTKISTTGLYSASIFSCSDRCGVSSMRWILGLISACQTWCNLLIWVRTLLSFGSESGRRGSPRSRSVRTFSNCATFASISCRNSAEGCCTCWASRKAMWYERMRSLPASLIACAALQPPGHIQRRTDGDQGNEKIEYQQAGDLFLEFQYCNHVSLLPISVKWIAAARLRNLNCSADY